MRRSISPGNGGCVCKLSWSLGCVALVFATEIEGYGDRGPKAYPWLRKMGENQTLAIGNITKSTTFGAILHEYGQIWAKFCHLLRKKKNGGITEVKMSKICWKYTLGYGAPAKIRPLAIEILPKIDPWLRKLGSKGTLAGGTPQVRC